MYHKIRSGLRTRFASLVTRIETVKRYCNSPQAHHLNIGRIENGIWRFSRVAQHCIIITLDFRVVLLCERLEYGHNYVWGQPLLIIDHAGDDNQKNSHSVKWFERIRQTNFEIGTSFVRSPPKIQLVRGRAGTIHAQRYYTALPFLLFQKQQF